MKNNIILQLSSDLNNTFLTIYNNYDQEELKQTIILTLYQLQSCKIQNKDNFNCDCCISAGLNYDNKYPFLSFDIIDDGLGYMQIFTLRYIERKVNEYWNIILKMINISFNTESN